MMRYSRLAAVFCLGVTVLAVAACSDDPGSVGANFGSDGSSTGVPKDTSIVVSSTGTRTTPSTTGISSTDDAWRFLTGTVNDDLAGTIETTGYLDFDGSGERPDPIANAAPSDLNAELLLTRSYVHGNTTTDLTVALFDLSQAADMGGANADESFSAESSAIDTYTLSPTGGDRTLDLPQSWIEEHQDDLQGSSFSNFYGFRLTTTSGEAVVGFEHESASLRLTTSSDTVTFPANQSFTNIEQTSPPAPLPDDRRLLLDGIGTSLTFDWATDSPLGSLAGTTDRLNQAVITVPIDTSFRAPSSGNFVRPTPSGYRLLAIENDDSPTCSALGFVSRSIGNDSGCGLPTNTARAPGDARTTRGAGLTLLERWFDTGTRPFPAFRLEIANRDAVNPSDRETTRRGLPSTIPVTVRLPSGSFDQDTLPRVDLTVTPL